MKGKLPGWVRGYLARYKRQVATALALGLLASACSALLMFTSGYLISATALASTTLFAIMTPVACVQLFGFGRPLARYAERLASHDWVLHVTSHLRLALFRGIERRIGDPAREKAAGEYLALLADDVAHLQNLYLRVVFPTAIAYLLAIGAALAFGFFSAPFALVMLIALAAVAFPLPLCALLATRALQEQAKELKAAETAALADDLFGATDWVLAGRGGDALARHAEDAHSVKRLEAQARMRVRALSLISSLALGALACAVLAWAGASFAGDPGDAGAANWIAAFVLGFFPLIESFAVLPAAFSETTAHRASIERLDDYVAHDGSEARSSRPIARGLPCALRFDGVSYRYPGQRRLALDGVTLDIPHGQSVAVLGRSGSGKSTLAKLACATLSPDEGSVSTCGHVGFLGQEPYLFNRTLRENVALGAPGISDAAIANLLDKVGLSAKLAELPDGLDTVIGETGVGLSGGEAHRVALARMLAADAPVVIVDEPFSALDPEAERALLDTLLDACSDRALIVITHHLAEIERFDRVVFIEGGSVELDGSPSALLAESARFRALVAFDRDR